MKKKALWLLALAAMAFSLAACGSGEDSGEKPEKDTNVFENMAKAVGFYGDIEELTAAERYFEALENTIKADSYRAYLKIYEEEGCGYCCNLKKASSDGKVYAGGECGEFDEEEGFESGGLYYDSGYRYCDGELFGYDIVDPEDPGNSGGASYEYLDMALDENIYEDYEDEDYETETEGYFIYKIFQSFKNEDVNDFMSDIESGAACYDCHMPGPSYREYKKAVIQILQDYEEDKNGMSLVKSYNADGNRFELVMYAYDFFCWCDENIDSYSMSDVEGLIEYKNDAELDVSVGVDDKGCVTDYAYCLTIEKEGYKAGFSLEFSDVNSPDLNAGCVADYNEAIEAVKPGDYKYAAANMINELEEYYDEPGMRYKLDESKDSDTAYGLYAADAADEDYYFDCYEYDGYEYGYVDGGYEDDLLDYHTAEDMLAYLQDGKPLPEAPEWKRTYLDYLLSGELEDVECYRYSLINVDGDDVPELFGYSGGTAFGTILLSIYDGRVIENRMSAGGFYYFEGENRFYASGGRMDSYTDRICHLDKGKLVEDIGGWFGLEDNTVVVDENGATIPYSYEWNNKEVSKQIYQSLLEKAFDESAAERIDDGYDEEESISILSIVD